MHLLRSLVWKKARLHHQLTEGQLMSDNANDGEISLLDTLAFVQESWKTISGVGLAGAAWPAGLLTVTPGQ